MTSKRIDDREREIKLGVADAAAFDALLAVAGGARSAPVIQENHFFDTRDRSLGAEKIALRLRREDGRFLVTLKGPLRAAAGARLAERVEVERELAPEPATALLASRDPGTALLDALAAAASGREGARLLASAREACAGSRVERLGGFRNERTRVRTDLAVAGRDLPVTLEFDRTEFAPGDVRLEVELELAPGDPADAVQGALLELFRSAGAEPRAVTSKFEHFLERLERGDRA